MPETRYEWQFGEDAWEEAPAQRDRRISLPPDRPATPAAASLARPRIGRGPLAVLLGSVLILAAVAIVVAGRVDAAAAPVRQAVLETFEAAQYAIRQSDHDLFAALLSDRTWGWDKAERDLFDSGMIDRRAALGLQGPSAEPASVDVRLSPDLSRAAVVSDYAYTTRARDDLTETIRLQQTNVFRRDGQRWLLAPPDDAFWGPFLTNQGRRVKLVYPERDESVAHRLAVDLDRAIGQLCAEVVEPICPSSPQVTVRLSTDLSRLADMLGRANRQSWTYPVRRTQASDIFLPTPTLVGLPLDEAGYQALYRGYATQVVDQFLDPTLSQPSSWSAWYVREAQLDVERIRLGLHPWPLTVDQVHGPAIVSGPDQDVLLYCVEGLGQRGTLYRYRPDVNAWNVEVRNRLLTAMVSRADDRIVLQEQSQLTAGASSRLLAWKGGREQVLLDRSPTTDAVQLLGQTDSAQRYLVLDFNTHVGASTSSYALLDLDKCNATGCALIALPGWPIWSPDGAHTLIQARTQTLLLGDAQGQSTAEIGSGSGAFWIDSQTYGYVRLEETAGFSRTFQVVLATLANPSGRVLFDSDDLAYLLPDREPPENFWINFVQVNAADKNTLLVSAISFARLEPSAYQAPETRDYTFLFDRRSGGITLSEQAAGDTRSTTFSSDGRWLITTASNPSEPGNTFEYEAIDGGQTFSYTFPSYSPSQAVQASIAASADGRWLAVLSDGVLHLVAPYEGYQRTVVPEVPGCIFPAWTNR